MMNRVAAAQTEAPPGLDLACLAAKERTFIELWVVPNSSGEPLHEFVS